jgi:hypothetical protein
MVTSSNQARKRKEMSSLTRIHRSGCSVDHELGGSCFCLLPSNSKPWWFREISMNMIQRESESKVINEFHDTPLRIPPFERSTLETNAELWSYRELQEFPRSRGDGVAYWDWTDQLVGLARAFLFFANCFSKWGKWVFFEFSSRQIWNCFWNSPDSILSPSR